MKGVVFKILAALVLLVAISAVPAAGPADAGPNGNPGSCPNGNC